MNKTPLTVAGAEKLRAELHRLKTVERPSVIAAIASAPPMPARIAPPTWPIRDAAASSAALRPAPSDAK